jgi:hypothetical protein
VHFNHFVNFDTKLPPGGQNWQEVPDFLFLLCLLLDPFSQKNIQICSSHTYQEHFWVIVFMQFGLFQYLLKVGQSAPIPQLHCQNCDSFEISEYIKYFVVGYDICVMQSLFAKCLLYSNIL